MISTRPRPLKRHRCLATAASLALLTGGIAAADPFTSAAGTSANLPGTSCSVFPANNIWHASVASLPVNSHSAAWLRHIGSYKLHPDFGPSYGELPVPYGIPITYVDGDHAKVHLHFQYADESDRVGYPYGSDTKIEGGSQTSNDGDRHAIVVDRSTCRVYETWHTRKKSSGWSAGSGATWSLKSNALRKNTWTSADAAGLPILPGLLRVDEVKAGLVDHAIRFTVSASSQHYLWPARHQAGSVSSISYVPMGARFRMKAGFPISKYSKATRVVLTAMKTYGMIVADNGSNWYFQGEASDAWPNKMLDELKSIPSSAFEAVDESSLQVSANSGQAAG